MRQLDDIAAHINSGTDFIIRHVEISPQANELIACTASKLCPRATLVPGSSGQRPFSTN